MNKSVSVLLIGDAIIWIIFLVISFSMLGVFFALFFSASFSGIYIGIVGGWKKVKMETKRDMYFSNKYDEEYGSRKTKK